MTQYEDMILETCPDGLVIVRAIKKGGIWIDTHEKCYPTPPPHHEIEKNVVRKR